MNTFLKAFQGHRQWLAVKDICDRLNSAGFDAVLAGGCVRDGLLGVAPKDFDIATSATPDQVEALFEKTIAVGKSFGVIMVPIEGGDTIEVATYRRDGNYTDGRRPTGVVFADREEDAKRRDFTINALFYDPKTDEVFDYVGGRRDLEDKVIRVVGRPDERFREDKLRLLRAVRFSGQLDFAIEDETEKAVRLFAPELRVVSRERIRDEIDKLLTANNPLRGFDAIQRLGLAGPVFGDWSPFVFPVHKKVFEAPLNQEGALDIRRSLLFYPALSRVTPDRVQERLRDWKYGRSFVEMITWLAKNENALRSPSKDPVARLLTRALILQKFEVTATETQESPEIRLYSEAERAWMNALELWTDERAVRACAILDVLKGHDDERDRALERRKLVLGQPDPARAKADELLQLPSAKTLQGPRLGRELRRLNRELLLR